MAAVERSASSGNSASSRPPPLTQTDAITSLLSLSIAAAGAAIAPSTTGSAADTDGTSALNTETASTSGIPGINGATDSTTSATPIVPAVTTTLTAAATSGSLGKHHRRLGSTGKTRRRLSDAREASARPVLVPAATSSAALSLASLSLSTSPPSGHSHSHSLSQSMQSLGNGYLGYGSLPSYQGYAYNGVPITSGSQPNGGAVPIPITNAASTSSEDAKSEGANGSVVVDGSESVGKGPTPIAISTSANGKTKKRGVDYRCESCSKIYRHPNCLNKHRWEHTRQWREASKFVLSKHQQVQLLEAAAILSFMGTSSTSLPDDRSEWPSFLSGGSLPKTEPVGAAGAANASTATSEYHAAAVTSGLGQSHYAPQQIQTGRTTTHPIHPHLVSSSVPNASSGPRMHDYSLPETGQSVKVTQVRPGLLGVPTNPVIDTSISHNGYETPTAAPSGENGWSLPNSSLRSDSYISSRRSASRSRSRSGSGSRSDESLDVEVDVDGMDAEVDVRVASANSAIRGSYTGYPAYSTISTTPGLSHSPGYGYLGHGHTAGYGYGHGYSGRRGMGMKREEDEMSVGFSVREEDEEEEEDAGSAVKGKQDSKWNGMEMEVDMDMD